MVWAQLLAYAAGAINRGLLVKNEYLVAENRILKTKVKGRLVLFEGEKATLAEIARRLGRKALEEVAATAQPDTILGWYRTEVRWVEVPAASRPTENPSRDRESGGADGERESRLGL